MGLTGELDRLWEQKTEQEETWAKELAEIRFQTKKDMTNLKKQYDDAKSNLETELEELKMRWKTELEWHQSSTKVLRDTIASLRKENIDLETSREEAQNLRKKLEKLKRGGAIEEL